jgi:hypothetical protein
MITIMSRFATAGLDKPVSARQDLHQSPSDFLICATVNRDLYAIPTSGTVSCSLNLPRAALNQLFACINGIKTAKGLNYNAFNQSSTGGGAMLLRRPVSWLMLLGLHSGIIARRRFGCNLLRRRR